MQVIRCRSAKEMKKIGAIILIVGFFLLFSPLLSNFTKGLAGSLERENETVQTTRDEQVSENTNESENTADQMTKITETAENNDVFKVYMADSGEVAELTALDYITGVVAAEMPAYFDEEALKAQAVTSYTYACYVRDRASHDQNNQIRGADLSDQSSSYQAYRSTENLKSIWGDDFQTYYSKVRNAVSEVIGKKIVYDDEPIMAAFHAMSWGMTEDCENVWGGELTYLKSVDSAEDSENSSFINTFVFTDSEFKKILGISGNIEIGEIVYTTAGMVDTVTVNSVVYTGTRIRSLFSLASPCFTINRTDGNIIFTTKGKGHGVGMSQNGANALAKEGYTWDEIILHYYSGVTIV